MTGMPSSVGEHDVTPHGEKRREEGTSARLSCDLHPDEEAAFVCMQCGRLACATCAPERRVEFHFCPSCKGLCEPLVPPGRRSGEDHLGASSTAQPRPMEDPGSFADEFVRTLAIPFRGTGGLTCLVWSAVVGLSWFLWWVLFVPFLWSVHEEVSGGATTLPAPTRLGGGPVRWFWRLLRLFMVMLPAMACLGFLVPRPGGQMPPAPVLVRVVASIGLGASLFFLPLMAMTVLRTGNPLRAYQVTGLRRLLRACWPSYLGLLASQTFIIAVSVTVHAALVMIASLAGRGHGPLPTGMARLAHAVPWVLGPLWFTIELARFGRRIAIELGD